MVGLTTIITTSSQAGQQKLKTRGSTRKHQYLVNREAFEDIELGRGRPGCSIGDEPSLLDSCPVSINTLAFEDEADHLQVQLPARVT